MATCEACGKSLQYAGRGRPRKWCKACRPNYYPGEGYVSRRRSVGGCEFCHRLYPVSGQWQRFCSRRCANRQWEYDNPEKARRRGREWRGPRQDAHHRRRARLTGAVIVEPVDLAAVLERDGGICQICGYPVRGTWPARLSASLDHIVPLVRGGAHSLENVQLAHLGCNSRKGAR